MTFTQGPQDRLPSDRLPADLVEPARRAGSGPLRCPLCGCTQFREEEERTDGRWGFSHHVVLLKICRQCSFILSFYERTTFWG